MSNRHKRTCSSVFCLPLRRLAAVEGLLRHALRAVHAVPLVVLLRLAQKAVRDLFRRGPALGRLEVAPEQRREGLREQQVAQRVLPPGRMFIERINQRQSL